MCRRSRVFSYISRLFVSQGKLKCFVFSKIQTLFAKHRGWGYPSPAFQFETRQAPVHTHAAAHLEWYWDLAGVPECGASTTELAASSFVAVVRGADDAHTAQFI